MRLYTQEQILRLIKLYNTSDNSEKELLKKYVEHALYKYFNHKLKTKNTIIEIVAGVLIASLTYVQFFLQ